MRAAAGSPEDGARYAPAGLRSRHLTVLLAFLAAFALVVAALPPSATAHPDGKGDQDHHDANGDGEYSESFGVNVLGSENPGGFNGDVVALGDYAFMGSWGNAASPDGRQFPFCPSLGVRVFDISDPAEPEHVATFADAASDRRLRGSWTEKVIVADVDTRHFTGTLAAVSVQNCMPNGARGWGVWDVTDPEKPSLLHFRRTESEVRTVAGSHEIWLEVREDSAYVYTAEILRELRQSDPDEDHFEPDMQIWDVSNPRGPRNVGSWGVWQDEGTHPLAQDEDGTTRVRFVHSVTVADETAYVSYWDRGTVILDVTDPSDPTFVASVDVPTEGLWSRGSMHSTWLGDGGDLLIETPEVFSPFPDANSDQETAFGYPRFTDISSPANPQVLGGFEMDTTREHPADLPHGFWTTHDPKVRPGLPGDENLAYISWYAEGVAIVDIDEVIAASDPAEGITAGEEDALVAQFVPEPAEDPFGFFGPSGTAFPNVWGVFLHEIEGRQIALASDINSGLWIFELDTDATD